MRKLKLFMAACALMGASTAWAQTDVTSQYLTNADFSQGTPIDNHLCGYGKDMGTNGTTYYGLQDVQGWTITVLAGDDSNPDYLNSGVAGATFAYGSEWQLKGNSKTAPAAGPDASSTNCLGFFAVWGLGGYYSQDVTFPAGKYTITIPMYNQSGTQANESYTGFFPEEGTAYTCAVNPTVGQWVNRTVEFTITEQTKGQIRLGYKSTGNGSAANPMIFIDGVKIEYTDPLAGAKADLQAEIDKAKQCDESEGLANAIATAENALNTATTATELINALNALQTADKDAILRLENKLTAASATNPMETSFVVNGTFDNGISPWQRTGSFQNNKTANNQEGDFTGNFYENWHGSAQANKMYQTINNIPNGTYKLKIAAFVNNLADPNESQFVFANDDKVFLTTGAPTFYEVWTVVTANAVEVGLNQTEAVANWMGIDNVSLTYYGKGDVIDAAKAGAHKADWDLAVKEAKEALASNDYAGRGGQGRAYHR